MAAVPAVPSFATDETPSIAKLNQLAACVSFINFIPAYCSLSAGNQSVANSTATALTWGQVTDRDGGHSNVTNPTRYTAQTPGYYDLCAEIFFATSSSGARASYFRVTTGPGNPGGAGNVTVFGGKGCAPAGSTPALLCLGITSPYLYVGDYLEVLAFQASGGSLNSSGSWQLALVSLGP